MSKVSTADFIEICIQNEFDVVSITDELKKLNPSPHLRKAHIAARIATCRKKGLLPLASGNSVSPGEILKGSTTVFDADGSIKRQTVRTEVPKETYLESFRNAVTDIASAIPSLPTVNSPTVELDSDLATLYISNDVHFGALMWGEEVEEDFNTEVASERLRSAFDYLFSCSPNTEVGIITDLGDLLEVDSFSNMTPKSGNILDVDSRYQKILRTAYESLVYAVNKALSKHELVYFYNIEGNHDQSSGTAIREIMRMAFHDNPRVIINDSPKNIKYHQHGKTLLGFAHGDNLKMNQASETMAYDCNDIWSETRNRYFHFGHNHKQSVIDTKLCKIESHRNIAPLNAWAYNNGFRRGIGTMSSITYSAEYGEVSRQLYSVSIDTD